METWSVMMVNKMWRSRIVDCEEIIAKIDEIAILWWLRCNECDEAEENDILWWYNSSEIDTSENQKKTLPNYNESI